MCLHTEPQFTVSAELVNWCFEPSQPQTITSKLNTKFTLFPSYFFHKSCFLSLFIFRGHLTREPASNIVAYFILRAYTGTDVSHNQHGEKSGEVLEKMQVNGPEGRNKQGRNRWQ